MTNWNKGQKKILESIEKDHNILVSAAAGSGKTAVLVERIVESVASGRCGIDEILVVTFTKAAAAQMKAKIITQLEEKACKEENAELFRQLALAVNADISTIDSFCNRVVRENFQMAGVDPGFDLLDAGEGALLREDVLDKVLDDLYQDPEFYRFAQVFIRKTYNDADLRDLIFRVNRVADGFADPDAWLAQSEFSDDPVQDMLSRPWVDKYMSYVRQYALSEGEYFAEQKEKYLGETDPEKLGTAGKICEVMESDLDMVREIADLKDITQLQTYKAKTTKQFRKKDYSEFYDEALMEEFAKTRTTKRNGILDMLKGLSREDVEGELKFQAATNSQLLRVVRLFRDALMQEKKKRKKYDFSDVAHFAYNVLYDREKGCVSSVGKKYADKYKYIYIDEYQDGSDMQEHILNSVARCRDQEPCNIFMVGDVKQSIYRFRQARPQLFLEKEARYQKDGAAGEVLYLNQNYRSRPEILFGVNFVFRQVMRKEFGEIDYDENVQLNPPDEWDGETYPQYRPEILLSDPETEDETAVPVEPDVLEARMIGRKILELLSGDDPLMLPNEEFDRKKPVGEGNQPLRPAEYKDIVILQRSVARCGPMLEVYEKMGIPVQLEDPKAYFDAEEVVVVLSVLQLIDNARQDIPFAAVLRSPIGGCTDAELAFLAMHRIDRAENLFDTAVNWLEEEEENYGDLREKLILLMERLNAWKKESLYLSISRLIDRILEDTDYRSYVERMPSGDRRQNNLTQLMFKAEDFENAGNHGLFLFLRYIEKCKIHELDFGEIGNLSEGKNVVRVCTIHSSKGLEYPIVFVARLGKQFNKEDYKKMVTVSADFGIVPNVIRQVGGRYWVSLKGKLREVINQLDMQEFLYEELRLLYVAMTRAKERLFLTGVKKNLSEKLAKLQMKAGKEISYSGLVKADSYVDYILPVMFLKPEEAEKYFRVSIIDAEEIPDPAGVRKGEAPASPGYGSDAETVEEQEQAEKLAGKLMERYSFRYPYSSAVKTKTKLSVSEIKHEAMEIRAEHASKDEAVTPKPSNITGTDYGTAVHKLLELLPFERIEFMSDMEAELKKLLKGPFFNEDLQKALRIDRIKKFYSDSPDSLFRRMKRARERDELYTEQQFLVGLPANRLGQEIPVKEARDEEEPGGREEGTGYRFDTDEPIVLQGVIDGFFLEKDPDGKDYVVLMDYKTDRVDTPEELIGKYRAQLSLYKETIEDIMHLPVREMWLYGFADGIGEVRIPEEEAE